VPHERLRVKVEHGWVTIEGEVDWFYQKEAADRAIRYLTGVKGLSNHITLRARSTPTDVKRRIKEALERTADIDAGRITVEIQGNTAVLHGSVRSYAELRDAERAARNAPGITDVHNQLAITGTYAAV
jgi:osmotically-inducible protein OsmY